MPKLYGIPAFARTSPSSVASITVSGGSDTNSVISCLISSNENDFKISREINHLNF
jgi:hypothetical protein